MPGEKTIEYTNWFMEHRALFKALDKYKAMCHYSKNKIPKCKCCGETLYELLAIDHINGGGTRKRLSGEEGGGHHLATALKNKGYPKGYRVLCHNCNFVITYYNTCPHQGKAIKISASIPVSRETFIVRRLRKRYRNKVLNHYGSKCTCCGENNREFLTIDHINGERKGEGKKGGADLHKWIIDHNFPKRFRILCVGCNMSIGTFGECPHSIAKPFIKRLERKIKIASKSKPPIKIHKGEDNGAAKLSNYEVLKIRRLYKTGRYSQTKLGQKFDVSQVNVGRIVNRISFKELE